MPLNNAFSSRLVFDKSPTFLSLRVLTMDFCAFTIVVFVVPNSISSLPCPISYYIENITSQKSDWSILTQLKYFLVPPFLSSTKAHTGCWAFFHYYHFLPNAFFQRASTQLLFGHFSTETRIGVEIFVCHQNFWSISKRTAYPRAFPITQLQVASSAEEVHSGQCNWMFSFFNWSLILQTIFSNRSVTLIELQTQAINIRERIALTTISHCIWC